MMTGIGSSWTDINNCRIMQLLWHHNGISHNVGTCDLWHERMFLRPSSVLRRVFVMLCVMLVSLVVCLRLSFRKRTRSLNVVLFSRKLPPGLQPQTALYEWWPEGRFLQRGWACECWVVLWNVGKSVRDYWSPTVMVCTSVQKEPKKLSWLCLWIDREHAVGWPER